MSSSPAGIWSTSTHMNVKSGAWAPLVSFRPQSTATGGKAVARALALPSSITLLWAHLLFCPRLSYKCPTCLCPLTIVAISPRCLSSRKVMAQDTVYNTNFKMSTRKKQVKRGLPVCSCFFELHVLKITLNNKIYMQFTTDSCCCCLAAPLESILKVIGQQ